MVTILTIVRLDGPVVEDIETHAYLNCDLVVSHLKENVSSILDSDDLEISDVLSENEFFSLSDLSPDTPIEEVLQCISVVDLQKLYEALAPDAKAVIDVLEIKG